MRFSTEIVELQGEVAQARKQMLMRKSTSALSSFHSRVDAAFL